MKHVTIVNTKENPNLFVFKKKRKALKFVKKYIPPNMTITIQKIEIQK